MCLTFQMMTLEKYLTKNFEIFFRGYPHFGPLKCGISKNDHLSTTYDPTFLLQNPFLLEKCECLQKKLEINPFDKKLSQNFSFLCPVND